MILTDVAAERAVLAGICGFGSDAYFDVADMVSDKTFTDPTNSIVFQCLKSIIEDDNNAKVDFPSIVSAATRLELDYIFKKADEIRHIKSIMDMPVLFPNVRKLGAVIRKLEIARLLHSQLEYAQEKLLDVKGHEPVSQILGIAEDTIFDFTSLLNNTQEEEPKRLCDGLTEYIQYLMDNPVTQMGISSGYPTFDTAIGGGFRRGTVSMIGARTKVGKSILAINIGSHVAKNVKLPVLYLDTEMMMPDQQHRWLAMLTETPINSIETGQAGAEMFARKKLLDMAAQLEKDGVPFYYRNVSGRPFEEILAIARRWVMKTVGLNDDGTAKDCLVIYDYLKLMNQSELSADLKEYQLLGFMMTGLHNFGVRYSVPILSFIQLNRDGIKKESTDAASGSDRIIWLCSNFSIYKYKSDEEIAESGMDSGNRKLVPIIARHGGGLDDGDYINMRMTGKYAKIVEGKTAFELEKGSDGFVTDDDGNTAEVPFGD